MDEVIVPKAPDGRLPSVSHSSPVTQAGYTIIPNVILLRRGLTPTAKLVYGYLSHLSWRNENLPPDPPRDVIARDLDLSEKVVTAAVKELREAPSDPSDPGSPMLVVAVRRGQGRTNVYVINDPIEPPLQGRSRKADSDFLEEPDRPHHARARSSSEPKRENVRGNPPSPPAAELPESGGDLAEPPEVWIDGKQNLPLNALTDLCGIDQKSPRMTQAVLALNGRGKTVGIRSLFWIECQRYAEANDEEERLAALHASPEDFARLLADRIRRKGAALMERDHWRTSLEPRLLREQWLDLELRRADQGMSADDIRRFGAAVEGMDAAALRAFATGTSS